MEDRNSLFPSSPPLFSSIEFIVAAVGDLLDKTNVELADSGSYARLRMFSGVLPTLLGEEPFEH